MAYRLDGNVVVTDSLEIDVVDHCNLACRACSHLSPIAPKALAEPLRVEADLKTLSVVLRARRLKILGGEPLLHPRLGDVLAAVKRTQISEKIALITNGHLLDRLTDQCLLSLDEIVVSDYVSAPTSQEVIERAIARARKSSVALTINRFSQFREMFSARPALSPQLTKRIYRACRIAHVYGCLSVRDGVFYKCPQARVVHSFLRGSPSIDGIEITDADDFGERLIAYLRDPEPMSACQNCLGTCGMRFEHGQDSRRTWRQQLERSYEDLLDEQLLLHAEADSGYDEVPIFERVLDRGGT